jgi:hypothetical protein
MLGEIFNDVDGIISTFKDKPIDYCERLKDGGNDEE